MVRMRATGPPPCPEDRDGRSGRPTIPSLFVPLPTASCTPGGLGLALASPRPCARPLFGQGKGRPSRGGPSEVPQRKRPHTPGAGTRQGGARKEKAAHEGRPEF